MAYYPLALRAAARVFPVHQGVRAAPPTRHRHPVHQAVGAAGALPAVFPAAHH